MKSFLNIWGATLIIILMSVECFYAQVKSLDSNKALTQYKLRSWTVDDGLPSDAITDIVQSESGYIWITTFGGISKFDGVNFTNYSSQNTKALYTEAAKGLCADKEGVVWVGTQKGVAYIKDNMFYRHEKLNSLDEVDIESVFMDSKDRLWIGTNASGLFRLDADSLNNYIEFGGISLNSVFAIFEDNLGTIWIGTENGELIKYQNKNFTICDVNNCGIQINSFYQDSEGIIWVATSKGVYYILNDKLYKKNDINIVFIVSIIEGVNGYLWISSDIGGLCRYNKQTGETEFLKEINGLPNNRVQNILFDKQGNLWGGTYRNGLFQIIDSKFTCYSKLEGLYTNLNTAILEYNNDEYWVANELGLINIIKNGNIGKYNLKTPITSSQIKHMLKDSKGNVWLSTYSGLLKIGKQTETLYNIQNGFPDNFVRKTLEDAYGNIWVATNRKGLQKIDLNNNISTIDVSKGLSANYVMTVALYKDDIIIVGTKKGMNFIKNDEVIQTFTVANGMPDNFTFNVYVDADDILWIATNSGVSRYENGTFTNLSINSGLATNNIYDIVEDDYGNFWMPGPKGVMKLSKRQLNDYACGKITKVDYVMYDKSDGMKSSVCLGATKSIKDSRGNIWFLTSNGPAMINPSDNAANNVVPNVYVEKVFGTDSSYSTSERVILPPKYNRFNITYSALDLDYPENILFKYKLFPFEEAWIDAGTKRQVAYTNINPGKYTFQVKSTNSHGAWNENVAEVSITVLPAWYQTIVFKISTVLLVCMALFLLYRTRVLRIKKQRNFLEKQVSERTEALLKLNTQLEDRQSELEVKQEEITAQAENLELVNKELNNHKYHLEQLVLQRTAALEVAKEKAEESDRLKSAFLANMSHEIRTPMNAIVGFSSLLVNPAFDENAKKDMVVHINDNTNALLQLIENIITISKIEAKELKTHIRNLDLKKLLRDIYSEFESKFEMQGSNLIQLNLAIDDDIEPFFLVSDESHLESIIKNLLDNAFKFTDEGEVSFGYVFDKSNPDFVTLFVKDTGIGLSENQIDKIFNRFTKAELPTQKLYRGAGLGLSICKSLVKNVGGKIWLESVLNKGTTFFLSIPINLELSNKSNS